MDLKWGRKEKKIEEGRCQSKRWKKGGERGWRGGWGEEEKEEGGGCCERE